MDVKLSLCPFMSMMLACSATAETQSSLVSSDVNPGNSPIVELKYDQGKFSGQRAFDYGEYWEDGTAPGPGKSYRVSNGLLMGSGHGSASFKGDSLILGNSDNGTPGSLRHQYEVILDIPNLVLVNGDYRVWSNISQSQRSVRGAATVLSPESNRFRLCPCHDASTSSYIVNWEMTFTGALGVGLSVSDKCGTAVNPTSTLNILSSNPGYLGSFEVTGSNITMGVGSSHSLGGRLASFDQDALLIRNRATLASCTDGLVLDAADNRGIWIDSTEARVNVPERQMFTIGWPIDGDADSSLTKIGGGILVLPDPSTVKVPVAVEEGAIAAPRGTTGVYERVVFKNGGAFVCGLELGTVEIGELVKPSAAFRFPVIVRGNAEAGEVIPFLRVPSGMMTVADFAPKMGTGDYGAPFMEVTNIVDEVSGMDTFALVSLPVVVNNDVEGSVYGDNASHWKDDAEVHKGAAYVIKSTGVSEKKFLISSNQLKDDYEFPGHSLSFIGNNTAKKRSELYVNTYRSFTGDLRFYGRTGLYVGNWSRTYYYGSHAICGSIYVDTSDTHTLMCKMEPSATNLVLSANITGNGRIYFIKEESVEPSKNATVALTSANTQYYGHIQFYSGNYPSLNLRISDERNLGGNPTSYYDQALTLQGCVFHPIGTVTIDDPNRGIMFCGLSGLKVDEGERLIVRAPVSGYENPKVEKLGGGILQLGSASAKPFTLLVKEGYIAVEKPTVTDKVSVQFNGGGLVADMIAGETDVRSVYGNMLTNSTLSAAADVEIPVFVDYGGDISDINGPIPVATVLASRADEVFDKVRFVKNTPRGRWVSVREPLNVNGVECVRLSARYEKGFCVVIR